MRTCPRIEKEILPAPPDVTAAESEHGAVPPRCPWSSIVLDAALPDLEARANPPSVEVRAECVVDDRGEDRDGRIVEPVRSEGDGLRWFEVCADEADARMTNPEPDLRRVSELAIGGADGGRKEIDVESECKRRRRFARLIRESGLWTRQQGADANGDTGISKAHSQRWLQRPGPPKTRVRGRMTDESGVETSPWRN